MTDRNIRPIKIIDRDRCKECKHYTKESLLGEKWDLCTGGIYMPDINTTLTCPVYEKIQNGIKDNLDFKNHEYAITQRYAEIIIEGIETRNFSYWGNLLSSPNLNEKSSGGEMKGWSISAVPYDERNRVQCSVFGNVKGLYTQIHDITKAKILDGKLRLFSDKDPDYEQFGSFFFVQISDTDEVEPMPETIPKSFNEEQKSISEYYGVMEE